MCEGFVDLVNQHQTQVLRLQTIQCQVDGGELATHLDNVVRAPGG